MNKIDKILQKIKKFIDERDWNQFHNPKDLALSLSLEAAEVLELFQWKNKKQAQDYIKNNKERLSEELADVFYWTLLISSKFDIDIVEALEDKLEKNKKKYPIRKSKGRADKYNEL